MITVECPKCGRVAIDTERDARVRMMVDELCFEVNDKDVVKKIVEKYGFIYTGYVGYDEGGYSEPTTTVKIAEGDDAKAETR